MNSFLVLVPLIHTVIATDFYSFLKTGDLNCNERRDFTVTSSFQTPDNDVYLWSVDYLTRLKVLNTGELRIYNGYPKSVEKWTKQDFPYPSNLTLTPPTSVYPEAGGTFVTFFLNISVKDKQKSLQFIYTNEGYKFHKYNPIDVDFIDKHIDHSILFQSFLVIGKQRKRGRAMYELTWTLKPNETYFADFENSTVLKKGRLKYDDDVTGGVMVHHTEKWSLGYSFQGNYSVPLFMKINRNETELFTVVDTKYSDAVGTSMHYQNVFSDVGFKNRFVIPNAFWFGCVTDDWCYRGYIDEATTLWDSKLLVFSGRWLRVYDDINKPAIQTTPIHRYFNLNIPNYVDAAFTNRITNLTIILKDKHWFVLHRKRNTWFIKEEVTQLCEYENSSISAITYSTIIWTFGHIFVFSSLDARNSLVTRAINDSILTTDSIFGVFEDRQFSELVSGRTFIVDAVFKDTKSDDVFLVNSIFSYQISAKQFWYSKSNAEMKFQSLFGCDYETMNPLEIDRNIYKQRLQEAFASDTIFINKVDHNFKMMLDNVLKTTSVYFIVFIGIASVIAIGVVLFLLTKLKRDRPSDRRIRRYFRNRAKAKGKKATKKKPKRKTTKRRKGNTPKKGKRRNK
ncbi:hypothetical protein B4U80_13090 [Leptotrombidium deliense]|uniref:Uncharacterized protein n=1 Tax=Leptotrombidium deliense TaxID=299467 RepID=A0A443SCT3_9ACAR|nr:hypothetical protein B4U80_13090 [Leptotrombidium deliense]